MTQLTALVTGSSRGIGAAIAAGLRARGVQVIGHATRAVDSETIAANLTDPTAPAALWDEALERAGGQIDLLVNNAGQFVANPIGLSDIEWLDNWEDALRINLTAAAELSRYAVKFWNQGLHQDSTIMKVGEKDPLDPAYYWPLIVCLIGVVALFVALVLLRTVTEIRLRRLAVIEAREKQE